MGLQILGLVAGFALLLALLWLRAVAASVVPRLRLSRLAGAAAPPAYADLFAQADAELRALGFGAPFWTQSAPAPAGVPSQPLACVYRHASATVLATVMPPVELSRPNRPLLALTSILSDGSSLTSYSDSAATAFFASARQRKRSVGARDAAALWAAHQAWRGQFAAADRPLPLEDDAVVAQSERRYAELLDELQHAGVLRVDRHGALRLRLLAMLRLLVCLLRAPRPPRDTTAVPPMREAALFAYFERLRARAPSRATQWTLFGASAALFGAIGALAWDGRFALLLLGALVLHEGGHWLAMRAFGYANLQIVLLPLLGGVTTGSERVARGSHRALVALAGPLPGIALGWALLWLAFGPSLATVAPSWRGDLATAAAVLLALNYLNLLPIAPLDGGRFLQALRPRGGGRWAGLLVPLLAAAGLALAWWLHSVVLGLLVLLPLAGLRTLGRDARLARTLRGHFAAEGIVSADRDAQLVAAVAAEGAQGGMVRRFLRVERLRSLIDLVPPRPRTRVALLLLYLAAFVLPPLLAPGVTDALRAPLLPHAGPEAADRLARYRSAAQGLTLTQLVDAMAAAARTAAADAGFDAAEDRTAAPPPPDETDFAAAESRLGAPLPAEYRELARSPQRAILGLRAPAALERADGAFARALPTWSAPDTIRAAEATGEAEHTLPRRALDGMWVLAGESPDQALLFDGRGDPALACCRALFFDDDSVTTYASLREYVVERYASLQSYAAFSRQQRRRREAALAESADWPQAQLVEALARRREHLGQWQDVDVRPRDEAALAAAERRVGSLPADYRAFLAQRNGLPAAGLLPLDEITPLQAASTETGPLRALPWWRMDADGRRAESITAEQALHGRAVTVGALRRVPGAPAAARVPLLVLVADGGQWRYLDGYQRQVHGSLRALLRSRLAVLRSQEPCPRCIEDAP